MKIRHRRPASLYELAASIRQELHESYDHCRGEIKDAQDEHEELHKLRAQSLISSQYATRIGTLAEQTETCFERFSDEHVQAGKDFRKEQTNRGLCRLPKKKANRLATTYLVTGWVIVEGLGASYMLASSGDMGIEVAFGYGIAFACLTTIVALLTGFFGWRYYFRSPATYPEPGEDVQHRLAGAGIIAGLVALLLLIFTTARVRQIGSHEGIWNLIEYPVTGTFNDGIGLGLLVLGLATGIFGVIKGASLEDEPGFRQLYEAQSKIDDKADELLENAKEDVEDVVDESEDEHDGYLDSLKDMELEVKDAEISAIEVCKSHNQKVMSGIEFVKTEARNKAYQDHVPLEVVLGDIDILVLDEFLIPTDRLFEATNDDGELPMLPKQDHLKAVNEAKDNAVKRIEIAYRQYKNSTRGSFYEQQAKKSA